ncbi:MAG: efflux transporter outer membrane subunit [Acidobacteria bacterium]|nr:efflux transporter outer membrane subunit [Acidobacteriota bacterium]MBS1866853.1 efflux transporter outer membrane subunit [Acidobacteriota bacterium]
MVNRYCLLLLAAVVLAGCTVGPNYRRPVVPVPPAFRDSTNSTVTGSQAESFADLPWWQVFHDPVLQELIRTALKNNYDLLAATERINQARSQLGITRSNQLPQVQGSAGFSGGRGSSQQTSNILTLAADASYQLDLFGGLRRSTEAARAQLSGTEDARRVVVLTLVSDVASSYFQLLGLDLQHQIALDTIQTQTESVRLTQLRSDRGVATQADVLQAQQVLDTANAQIPDLERRIGQTEDAISILLGNYPQGVHRVQKLTEQQGPPEVPAGLTSALLERRPDIHEAEEALIAANAEIGVAKAAFFPQISLTGSGGGAIGHVSLSGIGTSANTGLWSYGGGLVQPVFTGGRLISNLNLAKSQERGALLFYKQTIQRAFGDVSDALIAYQKIREQRSRQEQSVKTLQDAVRLSDLRYRGGITTFLEVLDNQRSLFSAQLTLAQIRTSEYLTVVTLYKALGGGWQQ